MERLQAAVNLRPILLQIPNLHDKAVLLPLPYDNKRLSPAFRFLHLPGKNGARHPKPQRVGQMVYLHVIDLHMIPLQFSTTFYIDPVPVC